jgi:hypothetical protein
VAGSAALVQLSVSEKSPLAAILEIEREVVPLFVTVTLWGALGVPTCWDPNESDDFDKETVEVVPLRFTTWGVFGALAVVIASDACRIPTAVGAKEMVNVHVAPTASGELVGQVVVSVKSLGSFPESTMLVIVCVLSPFVSVTVCDWLVVLRLCAGKTKLAGLTAIPAKMLTLAMYASQLPPGTAWTALASGKSVEHVCPVTYAEPLLSTAIPVANSVFVPPR